MDDVIPSTNSAAVGKSTDDATTCDTRDKVRNLHPSKTKMKTKVNVEDYKELNLASGSTKIHSEHPNNESNKKTNKTNNQAYITTPQADNIKVIGTGSKHTGGGIKNSFHGVSYQMKLPMHFLLRGLKQNCTFQVATEVEEAGKFDDLIFLYEEDEIGLFQAKHKLDENSKITENQLLSMDGDFSIPKYFDSYNEILNRKELLQARDMTLILCTNIGIDDALRENNFEHITASQVLADNHILALGTEIERNYYYILKQDSSSQLYKNLVKLLSNRKVQSSRKEPPRRVAERFAKRVLSYEKKTSNRPKTSDSMFNGLFENNHEWFLDNVFEMNKGNNEIQVYMTFKDNFLSEKCESNFQNVFSETYLSNKQTGKKDKISLQDHLSGVKFDISESFASTFKIETEKTRHDTVKKFLDVLVFAVNQPNDTKLGDIIEEEINDYMGLSGRNLIASKFMLYIQKWATQKVGRYLKNEDIERQIAVWGQETLNEIKINDIKKHGCTFEESHEVIKKLSNFLMTENDANVLCLYNRVELFSKIKVCQALETFSSKNINQNFIFCDIKDLIELETTKKSPMKAFSSPTCNIMFLSLQEGQLYDTEVLNRLLEIVIKSNRSAEKPQFVKRLIIGIPEKEKSAYDNKFCSKNLGIEIESLDDFDNSFNELDKKSRQQLKDKGRFKLHGNNITDLLSDSELSFYIRDEMLFSLISCELKIDDGAATNHYYNEEVKQYYVNRSLEPIIVAQNITDDSKFHFVHEDKLQTNIKNQEVIVISSNENLFEQFRKTNIDVHWLKEVNSEYIWVTSQGSLSNIRKYVAAYDVDKNENCIPITNVSDLKNDVVLISASPGMGKSILLSHVAEQAKKGDNSHFIFKSNLADYCTQLDSIDEESITIKQAIYFAFIATQIESPQIEESKSAFNLLTVEEDGSITFSPNAHFGHQDHLRAMVFCKMYDKEKIVLLLDGFDEIAPDYCKTTLDLLHALKHSKVRKMWVTTRPYGITKSLENDLETFAYTLKPLSEDSQLMLIENFWEHQIKSEHANLISSLKDFLNSINMTTLSALHKAEKKQNSNNSPTFMGVPLHCYMLAKVLTKDFTKFCSQENKFSDFHAIEKPLTIFDLYSNFFNTKFDEILYNVNLKDPKNTIFRKIKKERETDHGKLGLAEIFDEKLIIELVPDEDRMKLLTIVKSGNEKLGFVAEVVDNRPRFVHRTFAEYFAAQYLANILLSPVENKRKEAARSLLYNSITCNAEYYYVLFTFFNYVVVANSKNKDIFEAAISGNIRKLSKIENVKDMFDPLNRTPMHLIAMNLFHVFENFENAYRTTDLTTASTMYKYDHIFIQHLCQSLIKHSPDTLFTWMPTHYLTLCPAEYIIRKLPIAIQYLNNVSKDAHGRTPLMLLILNNSLLTSRVSIVNSRLNFNLTSVNIQDNYSKTALHYALQNFRDSISTQERNLEFQTAHWQYHMEIICFLLKHGARIDIPDDQGITPVDIINSMVTNKNEHLFKRLYADQNDVVYNSTCDDVYLTRMNYITEHIEKHVYNVLGFDEFDAPDHMSRTALHYTVKQKHNNAASNLIQKCIQPDVAHEECKCSVNTIIKSPLKKILLKQIFDAYDKPFLPVANIEALTVFFLDMLPPETAKYIMETTDLLTLSANNDDHKNIFIFIINRTLNNVETLLSKFPHLVDVVDSRGRTALHYAVKNGNQLRVISLLKRNARVDIPDKTGKTPAHLNKTLDGKYVAYFERTMQVDKELEITAGDQTMLTCINGLPFKIAKRLVLTMALFPPLTPFDHVLLNYIFDHLHIIASVLWAEYSDLFKAKSKKNCSYFDCTKVSNKVACTLLENYQIEDFSDNALKSNDILKSAVELFSSVKNNNLSQVQTLLRRIEAYNVNTVPDLSTVPLPYKEVHISAGVVNARTKDGGRTALHYVAEIGNAEIAQCLLSHGAWYNVPDFHGSTPAQIAKTHANTNVLHLLNMVEMLFNCLNSEAYDIAQNIVVKENINGNLFNCIHFETGWSLIYLTLRQNNWLLLNSLVFH